MVKQLSKFIIVFTILVVIGFTIYKINKKHEDKLYGVLYSNIEYNASKCYLSKNCKSEFTLQDLYDKEYIEIQYDPISKEELDNRIKIKVVDDKIMIEKKNKN